jgi:hypothetical protein
MLEIWGEGKSQATKTPAPQPPHPRMSPTMGFNVYAKEFVPSMYPQSSQYQAPPPPPPPPPLPQVHDSHMSNYGSYPPGPPEPAGYPQQRYLMSPPTMSQHHSSPPMSQHPSPPDVYRGPMGPPPVARAFSPEPEFSKADVPRTEVDNSAATPPEGEEEEPASTAMIPLSAALNPALASDPPRRATRGRSPELVKCELRGPFLQFPRSDPAMRSLSADTREPKVRTFDLSGCSDDCASVAETNFGDEVLFGPTDAEAPDPSKLLNPNATEFVPTIPQPPIEDENGSEYGELSKEMAEGAVRILGDELDLSSTRSSDGMDSM